MTAAYRLKGIGWMAVLVGIVLGFYLISLRVAAERKTLDDVNARVETAERDIRALETEFDTRANLAQLEKWNGDTLALAAPTAAQFVRDDAALASINPGQPGGPEVQTAALVVPSLPVMPAALTAPAQPAAVALHRPAGTAATAPAVKSAAAPVQMAAIRHPAPTTPAPTGKASAKVAPLAVAAAQARKPRAPVAHAGSALASLIDKRHREPDAARAHPQTVAMLDRKLLSDTTLGDILSGARAEARGRR